MTTNHIILADGQPSVSAVELWPGSNKYILVEVEGSGPHADLEHVLAEEDRCDIRIELCPAEARSVARALLAHAEALDGQA